MKIIIVDDERLGVRQFQMEAEYSAVAEPPNLLE